MEEDIRIMGETELPFDTDRPLPAILTDRRSLGLETLATGAAVQDRFQLGDMHWQRPLTAMQLPPVADSRAALDWIPTNWQQSSTGPTNHQLTCHDIERQ